MCIQIGKNIRHMARPPMIYRRDRGCYYCPGKNAAKKPNFCDISDSISEISDVNRFHSNSGVKSFSVQGF